MKTKTIPFWALLTTGAVAAWALLHRSEAPPSASVELPPASPPSAIAEAPSTAAAPPPTAPPLSTEPASPPTPTVPRPKASVRNSPAPSATISKGVPAAGNKTKPPVQDPTARVAMSFVGADLEAEAYWLDAIFDPTLPDREREDLMEDLNEEGLSDHQRPGPEDFPLIVSRLALIEEIAPEADEFMLRHLWEAYKDLVNLARITQGEGSPVR